MSKSKAGVPISTAQRFCMNNLVTTHLLGVGSLLLWPLRCLCWRGHWSLPTETSCRRRGRSRFRCCPLARSCRGRCSLLSIRNFSGLGFCIRNLLSLPGFLCLKTQFVANKKVVKSNSALESRNTWKGAARQKQNYWPWPRPWTIDPSCLLVALANRSCWS